MNRHIKICCVLLTYALFTILLTYPIAFKHDSIPGVFSDNMVFVWDIWWVKKAITELHTNPFYSSYIFHPLGTSLVYHTLSIFNGILSIPLQYIFSITATYNILIILHVFLSAVFLFWLVYYFTGNIRASFIAGLVYAFSPYQLQQCQAHLNRATIEFIPLAVLFLFKTYNNPKIIYSLVLALSLLAVCYTCEYYFVYIGFFIVIFLIYFLIFDKQGYINRYRFLKHFFISLSVLVIGILPLVYYLFIEGYRQKAIYGKWQEFCVADLLSFFVPGPGMFISRFFNLEWFRFTGSPPNRVAFLGYSVLLLCVIALIKIRFRHKRFWVFCFFFFIIMSLGPYLRINGKVYFNWTLPYYWLVLKVPVIKNARWAIAITVMTMMSASILVGYALDFLFVKIKRRIWGVGTFLFFLLVIPFEYLSIPLPMFKPKEFRFHHDVKNDKEDYAILDIPAFGCGGEVSELYMLYQTVHNKRITTGWLSRFSEEFRNSYLKNISRLIPSYLKSIKVKYIVVHKYLKGLLNPIYNPENYDPGNNPYYCFVLDSFFNKLSLSDEDKQDIDVYEVDWEESGYRRVFFNSAEFYISEDGDYIVKAMTSIEPNCPLVEEEGLSINFNKGRDLQDWELNTSNITFGYNFDEGGILLISTYFDGDSKEDEFLQMRMKEKVNVDLRRYPLFQLWHKVEDPDVQVVEVVFGIDIDNNNEADQWLRYFSHNSPSIFTRMPLNVYEMVRDRIPDIHNPILIDIEIYPHKRWWVDCTSSRKNYKFWIRGFRFYNDSIKGEGREVITKEVDLKDEWLLNKNSSIFYKNNLKKGFSVMKSPNTYIELSQVINRLDINKYPILWLSYCSKYYDRISVELLLGLDFNGDSIADEYISLGQIPCFPEEEDLKINILKSISEFYPNIRKGFLCRIVFRISDIPIDVPDDGKVIHFEKVRIYSNKIVSLDDYIFHMPVFMLDGVPIVYSRKFKSPEKQDGVIFDKGVFLKKGNHKISKMLYDDVVFIVMREE